MQEQSIGNRTNRKSRVLTILASLSGALLLAIATPALAGGFQISVETPTGSGDPQLKDAVLVARTYGCHQPADARLTASAEGLVEGNRKSLPLELHSAGSGVYSIKRQWPSEGKWVLVLTGTYNGMTSSVLVELGPKGNVLPGTRLQEGYLKGVRAKGARRAWLAEDIDSALHAAMTTAASDGSSELEAQASSPLSTITWILSGLGASAFTAGFVRRTRRPRNT